MMLTDLATACRKSGLTVVELSGWQSRARPASTGGFYPIGILAHHTGSPSGLTDGLNYAQWMATVGRSDLPAPLAQLGLGGDGTVYVMAAGRSNHAGTARAFGGWVGPGDANSQMLGIEAMHPGAGAWPQYAAYVALCAALCDHYGWPRSHVAGHKETSVTGKVDPGGIDMGAFRADIAAHNLSTAPTEEVDDMADYEGQLGRIETKLDRALQQGRNQTSRILAELADKPDGRLSRADVREASERAYKKIAAEQKESA